MALQDQNSTGNKSAKVRRAHLHITGIIIPRWWRGHYAVVLSVIAAVSVGLSLVMLDRASERMEEQQTAERENTGTPISPDRPVGWYRSKEPAPDLPLDALAKRFPLPDDASETQQATSRVLPDDTLADIQNDETARIYEEPLPDEVYEDAPVIKDAAGPRVTIPEEYIPEPETEQPKTKETDIQATDVDDIRSSEQTVVGNGGMPIADTETDVDIKPFEHDLLEQQQAWLTNAIPFVSENNGLPPDAPMIAIVIDDVGVDRLRSPGVIALPGPLTLSFLTYARDLETQTQAALDAGHELMIHIPMEPGSSTVDPGPNVLRVEDSVEQTLERLRWGLSQFDGYVGLNNHMGSKFTQDSTGVRAVLEEVRNRGLLFLDSRTAAGSVAAEIARDIGVPFATRNVFLDHVIEEDEIRMRLAQTERLARKNGAAVAIGHPHDATIRVLQEWLPTVSERGFMLVPMSELVRRTWLNDLPN